MHNIFEMVSIKEGKDLTLCFSPGLTRCIFQRRFKGQCYFKVRLQSERTATGRQYGFRYVPPVLKCTKSLTSSNVKLINSPPQPKPGTDHHSTDTHLAEMTFRALSCGPTNLSVFRCNEEISNFVFALCKFYHPLSPPKIQ